MIPCCCVSLFATLFFVRGHSLKRDDDAKLQEEGKQWAAKRRGILHSKVKRPTEIPPAVNSEKAAALEPKDRP